MFFGGAAGPGKTIALLCEGLRQIHIPTYRAIFFRRTYLELMQVIDLAWQIFPHHGGRYNTTDHVWTFPSGATYRLAYMERDKDRFRYQGHAFQYIAFDELTQYPNDVCYTYMFSRCRPFKQHDGTVCYIRAASNPGGPGHDWVKKRFVVDEWGVKLEPRRIRTIVAASGRTSYTRQFIPATLDSNDLMRETYEAMLDALPDPEMRRALREGDWEIAMGIVFSELRTNLHQIPSRPPLDDTAKVIVVDWGYASRAVAGWFETDAGLEGAPRSILYREMVTTEVDALSFARKLIQRSAGENVSSVIMDTNAWSPNPVTGGPSAAESMAPLFHAAGWTLKRAVKGPGSRVRGIQLLHTYLFPRATGPLLQIMQHCSYVWNQLASIQRGIPPHDPEDIEPDQEDHGLDMIRYFVQGRPQPAAPTLEDYAAVDPTRHLAADALSQMAARIDRAKDQKLMMVRDRGPAKPKQRRNPWDSPRTSRR